MGLSCPMCTYLPPLLSSNYAEQTKLSACCYKPASVDFDCYSSDGCLQLIKTLSQSTCRQSPKPTFNLVITAIVAAKLCNRVVSFYLRSELYLHLLYTDKIVKEGVGKAQ